MTTVHTPAVPFLGPALLATTSRRVVRLLAHPTVIGLHAAFREIVAEARSLDLTSDTQHALAVALADELIDALATHLVFLGQHPQPDNRRTIADWLTGTTLAGIRDELALAALWWQAELTPERLR